MSNKFDTAEALHLAQWLDRLQEFVDQALTPAETLQVHAHIANCTMCTREHRRLLAVDAQLRSELSNATTLSAQFDQRLFANIAALEQDKRTHALQLEQQEYAARLTQLRNNWRELIRFQLGNVIAGMATVAAVVTAIVSAWPTLTATINKELLVGAQQVARLPHGWIASVSTSVSISAVMASAVIAAAALWITRRIDRRR